MTRFYVGREALREKAKYLLVDSIDTKTFNIFIKKVLLAHFSLFIIFYFIYLCWYGDKRDIVIFGYPLLIGVIGYLQYVIAQGAHEAIHYYLSNKNTIRTEIVSILTLYCIGITKKYKRNHARHHVHFGDAKSDPDYHTFMGVPTSKLAFWRFLAGSLLGISALRRIFHLMLFEKNKAKQANNKSDEHNQVEVVKLAVVQLVILAIFFKLHMLWAYFAFWLLPLLLVTKTLIDVRLLAEHGPIGESSGVLRSFLRKGLSTRLLGVFGFQFHAHHHIVPGVPSERLEELVSALQSHLMSSRKSDTDFEIHLLDLSYFQFLKQYYYSLPLYHRRSSYVREL